MAQLAIDRDFLKDFAKLDRSVQERVSETFAKFQHAHHAGIHLEKITNARDNRFRTIRITQFWRGVVLAPESGDIYTLLKVLPHDDVTAWAQRRTASVNAATGRIEMRDVVAIDTTLPQLARLADGAPQLLFAHLKDSDMRRLGVDGETLAFARVLTDPVQLDAAKSFLSAAQWDVLAGLAAGLSPDEVWSELGAVITSQPFDTDDIDAAVKRSRERIVLVDGPDELMAVFAHPFALWRVYLHPVQRDVVENDYRGSARVTGGPGTGKTVVALHRAHELATRGEGQVLVTTFIRTLTSTGWLTRSSAPNTARPRCCRVRRKSRSGTRSSARSAHRSPPPSSGRNGARLSSPSSSGPRTSTWPSSASAVVVASVPGRRRKYGR